MPHFETSDAEKAKLFGDYVVRSIFEQNAEIRHAEATCLQSLVISVALLAFMFREVQQIADHSERMWAQFYLLFAPGLFLGFVGFYYTAHIRRCYASLAEAKKELICALNKPNLSLDYGHRLPFGDDASANFHAQMPKLVSWTGIILVFAGIMALVL